MGIFLEIVRRILVEQIKTIPMPNGMFISLEQAWRNRIVDQAGFETLSVDALRSVGIPARLGTNGIAEVFLDQNWWSVSKQR